MEEIRMLSPTERAIEESELRKELQGFIRCLRNTQASTTAEEFQVYLRDELQMDKAAVDDFLASDGSIESMTDRMWVFFDRRLRPRS